MVSTRQNLVPRRVDAYLRHRSKLSSTRPLSRKLWKTWRLALRPTGINRNGKGNVTDACECVAIRCKLAPHVRREIWRSDMSNIRYDVELLKQEDNPIC